MVAPSVVLSVRIRRELKEEAEKLGIDIRSVVERALEEAIRREKIRRLLSAAREAVRELSRVELEEWVAAVREARRG
ncbi:hypothetical protein Pyrfu_1198 [Pyrolobus fumarii 1A]|uniref:DUF4145 domain-containing protein n=1 Tax=Pyrolobus fumarii (strain DSM 11204 / 1A) TaxID=694429 RepID=G0EFV9_PYRF1|nr:hypothetical protein Pyrfu_1198 [Pyrolobus fumarii 1A]